jgi:peptidoglycan hydrolase-like protein with peptidoglycan-binding domain
MAAQRVLADYGYGQIRPTGIVGPETQEAVRKFERSRKMPVTGHLSDQVLRALSEMSGQPIE